MTGFKETEIGLLPEEWQVVRLADFIDFQRGSEPGSDNYNDNEDGIRFLRIVDLSGSRKVNIYTTANNLKKCNEDDILITLDGSIGIVRKGLKGAYSSGIRKVVINKDDLISDFVFFCLQTNYIQQVIHKYASGVTIKHASKAIPHFLIPLPKKEEQYNIAHILSQIQSAIETQEKIIQTTTEFKKALMQKLFTEGLKGEPQKETEIDLVPESWEVKSIVEIGSKFIGGGTPSTKMSDYWGGDIPWTTSKRLSDNLYLNDGEKQITKLGLENSSTHLVPKNSLIVSTRVTVGKVIINSIDIAINQDLTGIVIDSNKYNGQFLAYQIKTNRVQRIFESYKRGATIRGITREDLKGIKLAVPKLSEQREIANVLNTTDKKIITAMQKRDVLQTLFKSMLHHLMTGQIRVKDFKLA